jgi:hypothetical protein
VCVAGFVAASVTASPKSQLRDWKTLPASNVVVSVKVQSNERQLAVKLACGPVAPAGVVTVT